MCETQIPNVEPVPVSKEDRDIHEKELISLGHYYIHKHKHKHKDKLIQIL